MPTDHHRRSIRLSNYDYTQDGAYFITLCTYNRDLLLGVIEQDSVQLSPVGGMVQEEWLRTPAIHTYVTLDEYVIMPNHIHMIIILDHNRDNVTNADNVIVGAKRRFAPTTPPTTSPTPVTSGTRAGSIGAIIQGFKAVTTRRYHHLCKVSGTPLWQRNYYEHIIRHEKDLHAIRAYIQLNPARWLEDADNPARKNG